MPVVGFVHGGFPDARRVAAFRKGLNETGPRSIHWRGASSMHTKHSVASVEKIIEVWCCSRRSRLEVGSSFFPMVSMTSRIFYCATSMLSTVTVGSSQSVMTKSCCVAPSNFSFHADIPLEGAGG
jgi:hypothetical protein